MSGPEDGALPSFERLYQDAACGLLLTGRDGTIRRANHTLCHWLGYAAEDLVDKRRVQDLLTMGGKIFHQTHWSPLLQMQGSIAEVKLDLLHKDGHAIPMVMNAVNREHPTGGFHELSLLVAADRHKYERQLLSARKHAELASSQQQQAKIALELADARLRMALETAQMYVWGVDPASGERRYEPSIAVLLGYPAARPVTGDMFRAALEPADREAAVEAFEKVLDSRSDVFRSSFRVNGVDGVQRTIQATARALLESNGKARHIVGLMQDISELSRQRAAAEDRALFAEQMIGIVSHDLRSPLSAIMLGVEILGMAELTPSQQRVLNNIDRSVKRSRLLIDDLLDFTMARIGQGLTVDLRPIDLHKVIDNHVNELASSHRGHRLVHRILGTGPCQADADRLFQLISNLVANATTYGEPDSPITISSMAGPGECSVSVHNRGEAISASLMGSLFQPMVRGTGMPASGRSVGLGLYIVREIARAHGGRVSVSSTVTEGTTFVATWPTGDSTDL